MSSSAKARAARACLRFAVLIGVFALFAMLAVTVLPNTVASASEPFPTNEIDAAVEEAGASDASRADAPSEAADASPTSLFLTNKEQKDAFDQYHCADELVFCVDTRGIPLLKQTTAPASTIGKSNEEDLLPSPEKGDVIYVRVIGRETELKTHSFTVSADGVTRPTTADSCNREAGVFTDAVTRIAELVFTMPDQPSINVHVTSAPCSDPKRVETDVSFAFTLDKNTDFHFEGALLIPFVARGDRSVVAAPRPGSEDKLVHVREDVHITVGFALNYFPFGIRNSGPWTLPLVPCDGRTACAGKFVKQYLLSPLGMQFGTTLDFTSASFREWYLGLVYEPVRGGSFSLGVAFLQGDFLAPGFSEGMLLPINGQIPANAVDRRYMVRPYLGLTISPEVIGTIVNAVSEIKSLGRARDDK